MLFTKSKARTFEYIAQVGETAGKNDSTTKYLTAASCALVNPLGISVGIHMGMLFLRN